MEVEFVTFATIVVVALIVVGISTRFKVVSPNEALVRRRRGDQGWQKVSRGGYMLVLPLIHDHARLKLTARDIKVTLADVATSQGVEVAIEGAAAYKVGDDDASVRHAADRYLRTDIRKVDDIVGNALEDSLRSVVGTLTVEELTLDRQSLQQAVQSAASGDLEPTGLTIASFTIGAISGQKLDG